MQQQQQMMSSGVVGANPHDPALVYMPIPIRSKIYNRYQHKQSTALGITLIIIGILCIIFNGVCIGYAAADYDNDGLAFIGHGIWCGALFIITGGFGVGAGIKKVRCPIVSFLVLCIISATTTIALLTIGIAGACNAAGHCDANYNYGYDYNYNYGYGYPTYYPPCEKMSGHDVIVAMEALMAILGFIAGITAIWGSAIGCGSGVCCCSYSTPSTIAPQSAYFPNNGQIVYLNQSPSGQCIYLPQAFPQYSQGMMAPPYVASYTQHQWAMPPPINTNDPSIGQAPPQYPATLEVASGEGQPTDQRKY